MDKARLLAFLSIFWIGLALAGLLGHMVADAASSGCRINFESACQQETQTTPKKQQSAENNLENTTLHAGIDLPANILNVTSPMFVLSLIVLLLNPIPINLTPPPLPPQ